MPAPFDQRAHDLCGKTQVSPALRASLPDRDRLGQISPHHGRPRVACPVTFVCLRRMLASASPPLRLVASSRGEHETKRPTQEPVCDPSADPPHRSFNDAGIAQQAACPSVMARSDRSGLSRDLEYPPWVDDDALGRFPVSPKVVDDRRRLLSGAGARSRARSCELRASGAASSSKTHDAGFGRSRDVSPNRRVVTSTEAFASGKHKASRLAG